ncbi:MAG: DinB family protein [Acidobacteriales bacterium]|nr:DinB family protein [Terriglobales bacterium]
MADLHSVVAAGLTERYTTLSAEVHKLAAPLSEDEFWRKPFPFGNSFGHLVLHLTGNLNYYIGAEIAGTGYVRDRPREFTETKPPSKEQALKQFDDAVNVVLKTIRSQSSEDWGAKYIAKGEEDAETRMTIFLRCVTHLHHHVGQMMYLNYQLQPETKS